MKVTTFAGKEHHGSAKKNKKKLFLKKIIINLTAQVVVAVRSKGWERCVRIQGTQSPVWGSGVSSNRNLKTGWNITEGNTMILN